MFSGQLEDGFELAKKTTDELGEAFGQYELFRASIQQNKPEIIKKVVFMVSSAHDKNTALIDLVVSMFEVNFNNEARIDQLFQVPCRF